MRMFIIRKLMPGLAVLCLLGLGVPRIGHADDETKYTDAAARPSATAASSAKPSSGLTEREQWLLNRVEQLERRVAELEAKQPKSPTESAGLSSGASNSSDPSASPVKSASPGSPHTGVPSAAKSDIGPDSSTPQTARAGLPKPQPTQPFAYADWTWLNGSARNKDDVWDS